MTDTDDRLNHIEEEVHDLRDWTSRHDEEHTADTRLLATMFDLVQKHDLNAHGIRSRMAQVGYTGLVVGLLGLAIELIRRFVL